MYIKQIIIQGFKSYKEQTEIERFSPGLNVIVGRNGSGKSNFFAAIRFVLSDAYTQMNREERQALLHEGSGSAVMSAYVEIIFDNSDERFPTGKPELTLRRTIGLKKDEYSLDRKNATRSDVMNLLESAGFSRSNPYYIVPQGRVTALTNMKDVERLNLLKEVAGTQVYEARRTESLKSMQNAENLQSKIDVLLENVDERLNQLEEEKEELRKYQERDRESRCLQYTILNREQKEYNAAIAKIEDQRTVGVEATDENRERLDDLEQLVSELEQSITEARQTHDLQTSEKGQLDAERKDAQRDKAKLELEVQTLTAGQSTAQQAQLKHDQELQQVQQLVKARENQLAKLLPHYHEARIKEQEVDLKVGEAEATQKRLFTKQGRTSQFKSKQERDAFLKGEIDDVNVQLAQRKALAMQTNEDIAEMHQTIQSLEQGIEEKRARMDGRDDDISNLAVEAEKARESQEQLMDRRKELWRAESKLQSTLQIAQSELDNAQNSLQRLMDRNTWQGIQNVRRIKEEHSLDGVYGTLGELFTVSEANQTAVEVTGGTSLFNIVVDTDETASKVLDILNKTKGGRVTFMPLNRLNPQSLTMPNAQDAVSMISRLKYDKKYDKAFQQVFGKTVICPNLQVASQYARSQGVSAITPQGDRADKKGALTGGYHDIKKSRLKAIARENELRLLLEERRLELNEARDGINRLNQDITKAVSELQKMEQRRMQKDNSYGPLRQELRSQMGELHRLRQNLENKQSKKQEISIVENRLAEEQAAYETELNSAFSKALSSQEEQQLELLSAQLRDLRKSRQAFTDSRSALEQEKNTIEQELNENLRLRLDQLTGRDFEAETGGSTSNVSQKLKSQQRDLKRAAQILNDLERRVIEADSALEGSSQQITKLQQQRADRQQDREDLTKTIEKYRSRMENNLRRKAEATKLLAECTRKIRDLGVLPEEAFKKYERWESKKAMDRLQKVNKDLKQYKNVNKKAFEQFNNFTKQRTDLKKRREELDSSKSSIQNLVDHLDRKKDEAIERTFKQVSKEFKGVFEKLVPAGVGRLMMQRRNDPKAADGSEDDSEDERRKDSVENYVGVGISVSFNSKHDEQQRIQQLSGGQKSLCALALVFAIQQCDPAPFYLFDEIDANLDAQYRTAVAQMLQTLSEAREGGGQFICTTFRPEMLLVAEKCYGVSFSNKTSSVDVVTRDQAMDFVENTQMAR